MDAMIVDSDLPENVARLLGAAGRIAVDTETSGLDWSADELHLCQLFAPTTGPVLLRNVSSRPSRLAAVLEDPHVTKVFHFAPFDLRFLAARWDVRTESVECTKAASRLLDPRLPHRDHSLQALLDRHLHIAITKGATRTSDWSRSELSVDQVTYAADDVSHLLDLADVLLERLALAHRLETFTQICAYMPTDAFLEVGGYPNPLRY